MRRVQRFIGGRTIYHNDRCLGGREQKQNGGLSKESTASNHAIGDPIRSRRRGGERGKDREGEGAVLLYGDRARPTIRGAQQ